MENTNKKQLNNTAGRAKVFAIANQKGGVGKTTTALTLGEALTRLSKRVLVIDLDPHANASVHLSFYPENLTVTAHDLFFEDADFKTVWLKIVQKRETVGFDFVPASIRLSELEVDFKDRKNKGMVLSKALEEMKGHYDYILIDCPPHVGVLLVNAIVASDKVLIPIQTDFLALYGIRLLFDTIKILNKVLPRPVRFMALPTMYDGRAGACRRILNLIRRKLGEKVFSTVIHMDTKFREACASGRIIFDVDPNTRGALEYMQLAREIIRNENA
ncbi:ParA family protein [Maridesulfovibrio hydrothermalis]|uniref:Cobyrinic acid ac-diamide synthase n=1 Tax=Maridesulfovibrio hydrothermalis AM13 = DSM 14728 TaxID=1121451 RepID=L0RCZ2_9BACT|nr:ParA family protein [Maridesulfovibrio hydrothermalis]CCO24065.1 Cobyrinic acid ac-diamide synthase [Maridesulfovibrio hydrothermalis AM13 = DSM 14728]